MAPRHLVIRIADGSITESEGVGGGSSAIIKGFPPEALSAQSTKPLAARSNYLTEQPQLKSEWVISSQFQRCWDFYSLSSCGCDAGWTIRCFLAGRPRANPDGRLLF